MGERAGVETATDTTGDDAAASWLRRLLARVFGVDLQEQARQQQARGTEEVAGRLASLPAEWHVLDDVPVAAGTAGSGTDRLVVGPAGVFLVETVAQRGRVTVTDRCLMRRGTRVHYMHKSLRKAHKLQQAITGVLGAEVEVTPVLAVVGARLDRHDHLDGVSVVRSRDLVGWFTELVTRRLSPSDVTVVAAAAGLAGRQPAGAPAPARARAVA